MSRPQAVDSDVAWGGGRPRDDLVRSVPRVEATGCTTCTTRGSAVSTYAGGRRGKERGASLRAELRLAAGGRRFTPWSELASRAGLPRPGLVKRLADGVATGGDAAVAG